MKRKATGPVPLLLPAEVAGLFGVGPKTALRWAKDRKLSTLRTLGGHHRFHPEEVRRVLVERHEGEDLNRRLADLDKLIVSKR